MLAIRARAEGGLELQAENDGKLRILLAGQPVADGQLALGEGAADFGRISGPIGGQRSVEVSRESPGRMRMVTTYEHARLDAVLEVAGEDLTVTAAIHNLHPFGGPTLRLLKLGGLTVHFSRAPKGIAQSWHHSYLAHKGLDLMHPSSNSQLGCAFAADESLGFSAFCPSHLRRRKLVMAEFDREYDNIIPKDWRVKVYTDDELPPQCAFQLIVSMRLSRNTDWRHLLAPYRAEIAHEPLAYEPDDRALAKFANVDPAKANPLDNPFGFNGPERRLDQLEGVDKFIRMTADPLSKAGGLGCLFWAIQGYNPRGAMYRPDFDVFPPQIERFLPALVTSFKNRGLRVGLATRPGEVAERLNWREDVTTRISGTWQPAIDRQIARFKWAIDRGFDLFYLDSFGVNYEDYLILRQLRAAVGPKVLFWTEHAPDIMLPLTGRYAEWTETGELSLHSHQLADIFRYLVPGSSYCMIDRHYRKRPPLSVDDFGRHRYTPLIEDYEIANYVPLLQAVHARYLESNRWK